MRGVSCALKIAPIKVSLILMVLSPFIGVHVANANAKNSTKLNAVDAR